MRISDWSSDVCSSDLARKSDVGFGGGAGGWWGGGLAAAGGSSYQNPDVGQVIVLAYLDAYKQMVTQLGGLPLDASAAAPQAPYVLEGVGEGQGGFPAREEDRKRTRLNHSPYCAS